ncbi:Transcription factor iws1 [Coemansia sp. RSA 1813]|nr:Transcription factor iws1 [Coemansia sp. RSA 1646]KAJ1767342.1 Transcription factor iws1 [Coemansia sp. RSA 1843]KAJ2090446.1 Transcription factor iws1 [Coemansia sp. RSA 986]KAJ2215413.1 Transcription factor iws1 [Coemansia sp. RSA 487]KAJ2570002.1 Transcription factor iws1 [Coemansia sp. RSA 1813]
MSTDKLHLLDDSLGRNTGEDIHSSSPNNEDGGEIDDLFGGDGSDTENDNGSIPDATDDSSAGNRPLTSVAAMPKIPKRSQIALAGPDGQSSIERNIADQNDDSEREEKGRGDGADDDDDDEAGETPQQVDPKQAEIEEINKKIDAALKSGRSRRRKRTDEDDAAIDELIVALQKRMRDAAYRDIDDNKDRLPAIHKLSMLPEVIEELGKTQLYEAFLDNNIIDSIRLWLEPLDDGSLPNLDVQNAMLDCLKRLPIRRDHLRESGIGKIILFMSRCPRISEHNRRVCEQFVQQWSRMVLRLSSDYRDRRVKEAAVDLVHRRYTARRPVPSGESALAPGRIRIESGMGKDGERTTARIPQRVSGDYNVMPVSSVSMAGNQRRSGGRTATDKFKKLRQAMNKSTR